MSIIRQQLIPIHDLPNVWETIVNNSGSVAAGATAEPMAATAAGAGGSIDRGGADTPVYSFAALGCGGENSENQRKVAIGLDYIAKHKTIHQLQLLGDVIYPNGVSATDPAGAQEVIRRYIINYYGLGELFQTCIILGNHEPGFHGTFATKSKDQALAKVGTLIAELKNAVARAKALAASREEILAGVIGESFPVDAVDGSVSAAKLGVDEADD